VVVTTGAERRAKLQSNCHHQQTNNNVYLMPDALPVTQTPMSKN